MGAIVRNVVNDQLLRLSYKDPKNIKRFLRNWGGLEGLSEKGDTVATCILTDLKTVTAIDLDKYHKSDRAEFNKAYRKGKLSHYQYMSKDVIRAWGLNFNLGSAVKYISRAGHKDDIVQDLKKAQEFIQFEIDAIEGARAERKDKPKHEDFMDAMLRGLFGGSVGHIEITGKRNGKTDEEIAEIVDKTIRDIISGMAGVELEEIKEGNGYTEVHITGNVNPIEVREYIEKELKDRLAMVL